MQHRHDGYHMLSLRFKSALNGRHFSLPFLLFIFSSSFFFWFTLRTTQLKCQQNPSLYSISLVYTNCGLKFNTLDEFGVSTWLHSMTQFIPPYPSLFHSFPTPHPHFLFLSFFLNSFYSQSYIRLNGWW